MRLRFTVGFLILLLLAPCLSFAGEFRTIDERDALLLERSQLEIQLLEERVARLRERALRLAQDIQRKDNTEGWSLDLPNRRWEKPDPPKGK